jgi:zinc protease
VRAFYKRFASAAIGEMALIGPVQPGEVQAQLQQLLGNWTTSEPRKPWVYEYPASLPSTWQSIQVPDKANANYTARIPLAMNDDAPDFPALVTGIQLLGGRAGGTALWKRVREDEGLSYGVNTSLFVPTASRNSEGQGGQAAAINITASFAPQNRDKLRDVIRDEVAQRAARGFSSLEVGFARRAILSNLTNSLAQPADLAGRLANNLRYGRDMSRYTYFKQAYEKLDAEAVNAALRKHLDLSRMVEVAAGTFAQ